MAYSLNLFDWRSLVLNEPMACCCKYITMSSYNKSSFRQFFNQFFKLQSKEEDDLHLLCPPMASLEWICHCFSSRSVHPKLFPNAWKSILVARDLIFFPVMDFKKKNYCTAKVYDPHLGAREMRLHQAPTFLGLFSYNKGGNSKKSILKEHI